MPSPSDETTFPEISKPETTKFSATEALPQCTCTFV